MILNLRGPNASGKTTVMTRFLEKMGGKDSAETLLHEGKVLGYKFAGGGALERPVVVLGKYGAPVGGVDALRMEGVNDFLLKWIEDNAGDLHILFEGFMVSCSPRYWEELPPKLAPRGIASQFLFLNTPWETCLERFTARRGERGMNPATEKATEQKWRQIRKHFDRALEVGVSVRWVSGEDPDALVSYMVQLMKEDEVRHVRG